MPPRGGGRLRPARFLPFMLLGGEGFAFDAIRDVAIGGDPGPYWLLRTPRGLVSTYPIVTPVLATPVSYNRVFGRLTAGYGLLLTPAFFSHGPLPGLAGLLFSPGKGLLAFSPFLLFLAKPVRPDRLDLCLALAFALQLLTFAPTDWSGGYCYGPRFLVDSLPLVVLLLAPVVSPLGRAERIAFVALSLVGVLIQAIGAFCYPKGGSDWNLQAWSLVDSPMRLEAAAGLHPPRFLELVHKPPGPAAVLGLVPRATTIATGTVTNGEFVARLTVDRLGSGETATATIFTFRRQGDAIEIAPAPTVEQKL